MTNAVDSPPARILHLARSGALNVLFSTELLDECRQVLLRDRIRQRHGRTLVEIDEVLAEIAGSGRLIDPPRGPPEGPDRNDAHLWRLLKTDPLAVLITGDKALCERAPAWATVMSCREWLEWISAGGADE